MNNVCFTSTASLHQNVISQAWNTYFSVHHYEITVGINPENTQDGGTHTNKQTN